MTPPKGERTMAQAQYRPNPFTIAAHGLSYELVTTTPAKLVKVERVVGPHSPSGVEMVRAKVGYFVSIFHQLEGAELTHVHWNGPFTRAEADEAYASLLDIVKAPCDCLVCCS